MKSFYYSDGDMYGAGGTATSNFCRQSNWNEVFIIATVSIFDTFRYFVVAWR